MSRLDKALAPNEGKCQSMIDLSFIASLAEEHIERAIREGEFDHLKGKGRPLKLDDDSMTPSDCRMAYKILKNSGHLPPELQTEKEIRNIEQMLSECRDEKLKYRQIKKLNLLVANLNMRRRRPVLMEERERYYERVVDKVKVRGE